MIAITYPAGLPCPRVSVTTPAERRLSSDIPGNKQFRNLQRDYLATESIDWPVFTQAQTATFWSWWRDVLLEGGAWFSSDWPSPQGGIVVRRFIGVPQMQYVHAGTNKREWRFSAKCEVRGRGVVPVASDVLLRLPFDSTTGLNDVSRYRRARAEYVAGAIYGIPSNKPPSGMTMGEHKVGNGSLYTSYQDAAPFSNLVFVYADPGAMHGDFTIQAWLMYPEPRGYPAAAIPIASNGIVLSEFDNSLMGEGAWTVSIGNSSGANSSAFRWWTPAGKTAADVEAIVPIFPGPVVTWWHLAIVRKSGVIASYTDGTKYAELAYEGPVGGGYDVSLGGLRRLSPVGHSYWVPGLIDDVMISARAEYDGSFTPPTAPLRYR